MTIPPIFYTVVSERDGFYDTPLAWEQNPNNATRAQAEADRSERDPRYGRTWIVECRVLPHTQQEPDYD